MPSAIVLFVLSTVAILSPDPAVVNVAFKPYACSFFTYVSAEKLLGEKVIGVEAAASRADGNQRWRCTFTAASGKGKIYFGLFHEATEDAARAEFQKIRRSNERHEGFDEWPGIGDEAIAHSDGSSFHLVMVRKGRQTFRIKLNPINGSTLNDVKAVASLLAGKMK